MSVATARFVDGFSEAELVPSYKEGVERSKKATAPLSCASLGDCPFDRDLLRSARCYRVLFFQSGGFLFPIVSHRFPCRLVRHVIG